MGYIILFKIFFFYLKINHHQINDGRTNELQITLIININN